MPGDGVSLPTTLAQMGSVAKVQARATSQPQPTASFADRLDQKGELTAHHVPETEQQQAQGRVDEKGRSLDKRQRRRQRRQDRSDQPEDGTHVDDGGDPAADASPLGHLVDLRA